MDPDQTAPFRSSLIRVHTVCLYAKCKFEKFARRYSRRLKQTTFSDADFLGALRVNNEEPTGRCGIHYRAQVNPCPAEPGYMYPTFANSVDPDQLASEEAN